VILIYLQLNGHYLMMYLFLIITVTPKKLALANFSYLNLKQFKSIKNRKNSILDLILSNALSVEVECELDALVPIDYLYHPALLINMEIKFNIPPLYFNESVYDYLNCDYNIIRSSLASVNWHCVFNNLQINDAINAFYSIIFEIIDSYCIKKNIF